MSYILNFGIGDSLFLLPTKLIDEFLPSCDETSLKVLLYLIRHSHTKIEQDKILSHLHITPEQLDRAITYWCSTDLLTNAGDPPKKERKKPAPAAPEREDITGAPTEPVVSAMSFQGTAVRARHLQNDAAPHYTTEEVTYASNSDETLKALLTEVQHLMGKVLTNADVTTLYSFYDWLGLPADVIVLLISYCVQSGIKSMRGMEKVAIEWADNHVNSLEKAEEYISLAKGKKDMEHIVMKIMGIRDRSLTSKEKGYIAAWSGTMGFSAEMIEKAYEITIQSIRGKSPFPTPILF